MNFIILGYPCLRTSFFFFFFFYSMVRILDPSAFYSVYEKYVRDKFTTQAPEWFKNKFHTSVAVNILVTR